MQTKYGGKTSEIVTLHVQHIMQLPAVFGKNLLKICEFHKKDSVSRTSFRNNWKSTRINGIFCLLINKLPLITVELVTSDDNQQE